ncbi:cupin-like domain-containing protein [Longispora albida]|uniref:cupin-like domain-containing protein n=1 Tax=Longispora albida TaxID=203523 RepID=UPI00039C97C4|nr:cupin-like domain-containing protein [Longispora albida]
MKAERVSRIATTEFVTRYLEAGRPVIVTDAMEDWPAFGQWTPDYFAREYGDWKVPVYGHYFDLLKLMKLGDYIRTYMGSEPPPDIRYVRWFTLHQPVPNAERFPWADEVFKLLQPQWSHPYFLPTDSYLFPFCPPGRTLDVPSETTVPSKALYLSCKGATTNLHLDYWGADAVLCQLHGQKQLVLYSPDQTPLLMDPATDAVRGASGGRRVVDIRNPDRAAFPDFDKAQPTVLDVLNPGEIAYIPAGWLHHVDTLSDSITLTWNFVHLASWRNWFRFLTNEPPASELADIGHILLDDPRRLH